MVEPVDLHKIQQKNSTIMKATVNLLTLLFFFQLGAQQVEHVRIKSLRNKPIIQAEINGKKGYFLVDTGSDISIINSSQLKRYKLEAHPVYGNSNKAVGMSGQTICPKKVRNINVVFAEDFNHRNFLTLNIDGVVKSIEAKTSYRIDGIIGADVLLKYHCIIDYNQRLITMVSAVSRKHIAKK
jgi:hypothetical protein